MVDIYTEIFSTVREKETLPLVATQVNSEGNMLSDTSQTESGQNGTVSLTQSSFLSHSHRNREQKWWTQRLGERDKRGNTGQSV